MPENTATPDRGTASVFPRRAILLAAGRGTRLGMATRLTPKPLTKVGGKPIIERTLASLAAAGVTEAAIIVGYQADEFRRSLGTSVSDVQLTYIENMEFANTGDAYSLWCARDWFDEDIVLVEGDVLLTEAFFDSLRVSSSENVIFAGLPHRRFERGSIVKASDCGLDFELYTRREGMRPASLDGFVKTCNVFILRSNSLGGAIRPMLEGLVATPSGRSNADYDFAIRDSLHFGEWRVALAMDDCWHEIDDPIDLARANYLVGDSMERMKLLQVAGNVPLSQSLDDRSGTINRGAQFPALRRALAFGTFHAAPGPILGKQLVRDAAAAIFSADPELAVVSSSLWSMVAALNEGSGRVRGVGPIDESRYTPFLPDMKECKDDRAPMIISTPNSITGTIAALVDIVSFCHENSNRIVIVDESHHLSLGVSKESCLSIIEEVPNCIVIKNIYEMIGLGSPGLCVAFMGNPIQASILQSRLVADIIPDRCDVIMSAITEFRGQLVDQFAGARRGAIRLAAELNSLGLKTAPPSSNFVGFEAEEHVAETLFSRHELLVASFQFNERAWFRVQSKGSLDDARVVQAFSNIAQVD